MSIKKHIKLCEYCDYAIWGDTKTVKDCKYHQYHKDYKPCDYIQNAFIKNGYKDTLFSIVK